MSEWVDRATVSVVSRTTKKSCGTGFLVGPRHVLTCAHVVQTAMGDFKFGDSYLGMPTETLSLRFTSISNSKPVEATPCKWGGYVPHEERADIPDGSLDLALLRINDDSPDNIIPVEAKPVRFWNPSQDVLQRVFARVKSGEGVELKAIGHPKGNGFDVYPVRFLQDGTFNNKIITLRMIPDGSKDWGHLKFGGLSGAALVLKFGQDQWEELVIGMVTDVGSQEAHVTAKPIWPILDFLRSSPDELLEVIACDGFPHSKPAFRVVCHGAELKKDQAIPREQLVKMGRHTQREAVLKQTRAAIKEEGRLSLLLILGSRDNETEFWIREVIKEPGQVDPSLERLQVDGTTIVLMGEPILEQDRWFRAELQKLAKVLGLNGREIDKDHLSDDALMEKICVAFNTGWMGEIQIEPPPYIIYQLSVSHRDKFDPQSLHGVVGLWNDLVRHHGLKRKPVVFFSLSVQSLDSEQETQDKLGIIREKITSSANAGSANGASATDLGLAVRENRRSRLGWLDRWRSVSKLHNAPNVTKLSGQATRSQGPDGLVADIPPILGFCCLDVQEFVQNNTDIIGPGWSLAKKSAERITQTVADIFGVRRQAETISHHALRDELDQLQLLSE